MSLNKAFDDSRDDFAITSGYNRKNQHLSSSCRSNDELDIVKLLVPVLKRWQLIGICTVTVMILAAGWMMMTPNKYRSIATILPSGEQTQLSGLVSLAGLNLGTSSDQNSSTLFPIILISDRVIDEVLSIEYSIFEDGKSKPISMSDYFGTTSVEQLREGMRKSILVSTDKSTGVLQLTVETTNPQLSKALADRLLTELDVFNRQKRVSQAKEQADYLSGQLGQARSKLNASKSDLVLFQKANRNWASSTDPDLLMELSRLKQEAEVRFQAFLFLSKQYEVAQLDLQKDLPIVRVLDFPTLAEKKSSPHRTQVVLASGGIAVTLLMLVLLFAQVVKQHWNLTEAGSFSESEDVNGSAINRLQRVVLKSKVPDSV